MIAGLKSPGNVEVEILMTRQGHRGSFLVLEGDDDSRFWTPRVPKGDCEIVIGGGKLAVVGGIQRLDRQSFRQAIGIVDDDCDRLRKIQPYSPNLVQTDTRDMESLLLRSSAFFKVLAEYGESEKIARFEQGGATVRDALLQRALLLGRLRWLAYVRQADVDFKSLSPARFVDEAIWSFHEGALLDAAAQQGKLAPRPQLDGELAALVCPDAWQVCQGHDLVDILGIGLARVLGNRNPGRERIGAVLRAGIDSRELETLQLCRDLRAWEAAHAPLRVLE